MSALPDPAAPLTASGNLRRRESVSRLLETGAIASAVLAVGVFCIVVYSVASRGASALSFSFVTTDPIAPGVGGIAPAIVGTVVIVLIATAIAMPLGVLVAVYLSEFAGRRTARATRMALDLMNGLPTLVVGVVVYGLIVLHDGGKNSGIAGSIALAIIMLPLIARSSHQVLLLVPGSMREAADALGVSRWRAVIGVILPSALGGILTATILAAARAAGETAPLLLVDSLVIGNSVHANPFQAMSALPLAIFKDYDTPTATATAQAWGAALVLLTMILAANVIARVLLARSRSRLSR